MSFQPLIIPLKESWCSWTWSNGFLWRGNEIVQIGPRCSDISVVRGLGKSNLLWRSQFPKEGCISCNLNDTLGKGVVNENGRHRCIHPCLCHIAEEWSLLAHFCICKSILTVLKHLQQMKAINDHPHSCFGAFSPLESINFWNTDNTLPGSEMFCINVPKDDSHCISRRSCMPSGLPWLIKRSIFEQLDFPADRNTGGRCRGLY